MGEDYSRVEPESDDDRLDEYGQPYPPLSVWVNADYGRRSYSCVIQPNGMMTLPDGLVRELGIEIGDDLEWNLDEETGTLYVKVIRRPWQAPEWLDTDDEQEDE
jgi:hypothetical protein